MIQNEKDVYAVHKLIDQAEPSGERLLVGIAGPPGSGKSTLAAAVVNLINSEEKRAKSAILVPMDGYHLDNSTLDRIGLRGVKGSPETFAVKEFHKLLRDAKAGKNLRFPIFDRDQDCSLPEAGILGEGVPIVVVEGNYLLLEGGPWAEVSSLFDVSVFLSTPLAVLEKRLIDRWLSHGFSRAAAENKVRSNDLPNARTVLCHSRAADLKLV